MTKEKKAGLIEMLGENKTNIEIDGKKYTCREVTLIEMAQFMAEIRAELMEDLEEKAQKRFQFLKDAGMSEEICVREYTKLADSGNVDEYKLLATVKSMRGARHYFLTSAIDFHPELNLSKVKKLINEDNWQSIYMQMNNMRVRAEEERIEKRKAEAAKKGKTGQDGKNPTGGTVPPKE